MMFEQDQQADAQIKRFSLFLSVELSAALRVGFGKETDPMAPNSLPLSAPALASRRLPIAGEDEAYAIARKALLAEEIDLRRRMRQIADIRRSLPAGPLLKPYEFKAPDGSVLNLAQMFGEHDTLMIYACDFGKLGLSPRC